MPPKPSKGKKKESPEQRKARLEMEALVAAQEEAARKAAAAAELRQAAALEEELTAANMRRLDAEWLQHMRILKLEELHAEAKVLSRHHDAAVDRRDRSTEALLQDLAAHHAQHETAIASNSQVLGELSALHRQRMEALHEQFCSKLRGLQQEFEGERGEMVSLHLRTKKELADITAALQQSYAAARAQAAASYRLQEEEVRNRASEAYNVTKLSLEGHKRELEGQVAQEQQAYQGATAERQAAFEVLAAADAEAGAAIEQRTERLRHLQETLERWRGLIVANSSEWQRRNCALAEEKEALLGRHTALKAELSQFRAEQRARLKQMCLSCADVEAGLKQQLATAQCILRLAALCRKHEMPEEAAATVDAEGADLWESQAQPVAHAGADEWHLSCARQAAQQPAALGGRAGLTAEAGEEAACSRDSGSSLQKGQRCRSAAGVAAGDLTLLELGLQPGSCSERLVQAFMRHINRAVSLSGALGEERRRLSEENAALRAAIKTMQEGCSVTPAVVQGPGSTLLIVNERLQQELQRAAETAAAPQLHYHAAA